MLVASRIDGQPVDLAEGRTDAGQVAALLDRRSWRVALLTGPPGCGKTAAVATWASRSATRVVWRDLSDEDGRTLVRSAVEDLADRSLGTVVFDRVDEVDDPTFWVETGSLVDAGVVRVVLIARSPGSVPSGRWRAAGWLLELGPADLGVERSSRSMPRAELAAAWLERVLRGVDPAERRTLMRLSAVERFDSAMAVALAGPGAGDAVLALTRRGLLEEDGPHHRRIPLTLRRVLLARFRAQDRGECRRVELAAARHLAGTGDLARAYRSLVVGGQPDPARSLVVRPILDLARRGARQDLDRAIAALPAPVTVDEPRLAVAIADACLAVGRLTVADAWVIRLGELDAGDDAAVTRQRHLASAQLHLLRGEIELAERALAEIGSADSTWSTEERLAAAGIAARLALTRHRADLARELLTASATCASTEFAGLAGWCDLLDGDVIGARRRLDDVLDAAGRRLDRPDQAVLDALVIAAWAAYLSGDSVIASRYMALALADADRLPGDWNLLRTAGVAIVVLLDLGGPAPARSLLVETRLRQRAPSPLLDTQLDAAEVAILRSQGRPDAACAVVERIADGPSARLLCASLAIERTGSLVDPGLLDERDSWSAPQRIAAEVLCSLAEPTRLGVAVAEAGELGLVMPLTGHGPAVEAALRRLPLDELHPRLARRLATPSTAVPSLALTPIVPLTPRERTVLALLPSHLTYDQIASRLSLSVNTVKSNLKSIYRKLSVASRSDAVDAARAAHLV